MSSALGWLLAFSILLGPPLSVIGLVLCARRLRGRGAPRVSVLVAYVLAAVVGAVIVAGYVGAGIVVTHSVGGEGIEPSQKARALAEGISEAMNVETLALVVALAAVGWITFWNWRRGRR